MVIKVLGTGCKKCKKLEDQVRKALNELNLQAELIKEENMEEISRYNVMKTPALVIDEKVEISGRIPSVKELKKLIESKSNWFIIEA